ncbi:MAG: amino acid ABC transporter permease [Desulfobacteraceae bacterium]|nr:amino acid ABC transporter permease [Desulfobacteraceae bacterium]
MTNPRSLKQKDTYYIWVGIFFLIVIGGAVSLYYAALQIDYVWRWHSIPQYFVYEEQVEITSETYGDIESIELKDEQAVIRVKAENETKTYTVFAQTLTVDEGDMVSEGDILATYKEWRVGILMEGMWLTLKVSFIAIIFGILIGLFGGIARISSNPALKWTSITYIELIRGSPLLVQILIWYFVLGRLIDDLLGKFDISPISSLWYGVAALAFFTGAYVAEMVRAGIQSIHQGQTEASRSLGMTYVQSMLHIILPQAMRRILPPLAGQFISLIKDSSLLGVIAIRELTKATREIVTTSLQAFELYLICAILYLILTFTLSMFVQYLERRTAV